MDHFPANATKRIPVPSGEFFFRVCLAGLFAIIAHEIRWDSLRFLTSETTLRLSTLLGMTTTRISFDTIEVQGKLFQFVPSCTFAELYLGSLPLIWILDISLLANFVRLAAVASAVFGLNILRLQLGQIASSHGVPWILAHDIPLGFVYFVVWAAIWRNRSWRAWQYCALDAHLESSPGPDLNHSCEGACPNHPREAPFAL